MKIPSMLLLGAILFFLPAASLAQRYETVIFDAERNWFDEGEALPAETNFILNGEIIPEIQLVKAELFQDQAFRRPVTQATWTRKPGNQGSQFQLPVNYHLRSGTTYSMRLSFFESADSAEVEYLRTQLKSLLAAYIEEAVMVTGKKLSIRSNHKQMMNDMDDIVKKGCTLFMTQDQERWPGFSEIVLNRLKALNNKKVDRGELKTKGNIRNARSQMLHGHVDKLKELVAAEIDYYFNRDWVKRNMQAKILDYPVENSRRLLALNVGYGATRLGSSFKPLQYGSTFYAGISFPVTSYSNAPALLRNTSISTGLMISDFEDQDGNVYRGPFIKTPLYAALGYRVFQFVRLNAGITLLEKTAVENGVLPASGPKSFQIQPFIGLSAELLLWIGTSR